MSRRATDEELAAARELAREVQREGGLTGISLNELLEAFSVRRFTDASRDRISEALDRAGLTADPSLHDVERGDHLTLRSAGRGKVQVSGASEGPPTPWAAPIGDSTAAAPFAAAGRARARREAGHGDEPGAVAASTGGGEHGSRRWYRRPTRLAAIAAALLLALVWLGDDESPPDAGQSESPGVVISGGDDSDRQEAQEEQQRLEEARQRRADAREARERRELRAAARAAEKRRRARAARAARKRAAERRARRERREAQVAALAAQRAAEAQAAEEAAAATGGGGDCAAGYDPCIPSFPPDLDCADTGPVTVSGSDPHGLDADNDGVACGGD